MRQLTLKCCQSILHLSSPLHPPSATSSPYTQVLYCLVVQFSLMPAKLPFDAQSECVQQQKKTRLSCCLTPLYILVRQKKEPNQSKQLNPFGSYYALQCSCLFRPRPCQLIQNCTLENVVESKGKLLGYIKIVSPWTASTTQHLKITCLDRNGRNPIDGGDGGTR